MAFIVDPNTHIDGICQMPQDKLKEFASDTMNDKDTKRMTSQKCVGLLSNFRI